MNTTHWEYRAFCRGANPEIFDEAAHEETAKSYCQRCPVTRECLDRALSFGDTTEGVWGNTNQDERRALRRGGHRATCPGCTSVSVYSDGVTQICLSCGLAWNT